VLDRLREPRARRIEFATVMKSVLSIDAIDASDFLK